MLSVLPGSLVEVQLRKCPGVVVSGAVVNVCLNSCILYLCIYVLFVCVFVYLYISKSMAERLWR